MSCINCGKYKKQPYSDYCGETCAYSNIAYRTGKTPQCGYPGCSKDAFYDSGKRFSPGCGKYHCSLLLRMGIKHPIWKHR